MKVAVFTSCTTDEITIEEKTRTLPGGPGLYSSIMARKMRADVDLYASASKDARRILEHDSVNIIGESSKIPRFALNVRGGERDLRIVDVGDTLEYDGTSTADAAIVTPVYNEITPDVFERIKSDHEFVLLDPQGFLRRTNPDGTVSLERTDVCTGGVNAIKVDDDELGAITGGHDVLELAKSGIEHILHTTGRRIRMISGSREYRLTLANREIGDTTGVGDLFGAAFCCTMLKERDSLWAFCFACGAANAALDSRKDGIEKIPDRRAVETNAAYFYNTVEFSSI